VAKWQLPVGIVLAYRTGENFWIDATPIVRLLSLKDFLEALLEVIRNAR
jgi:hypothetical protein